MDIAPGTPSPNGKSLATEIFEAGIASKAQHMETPPKAHRTGLTGLRPELVTLSAKVGEKEAELERLKGTINVLSQVNDLKRAGDNAVWQIKATAISAVALIVFVHLVYARTTYDPPMHH